MTLQNMLTSIRNKDKISKYLMAASTGKKFENKISDKLIEDGDYVTIAKKEYQKSIFYKEIKDAILDSKSKSKPLNIPGVNKYFRYEKNRILIFQPHGANNYPDFLIINNDNVFPLEIKFSTKNGNKPTWNGGYPRSLSFYIFGSYGRNDITSFLGDDYLSSDERNAILAIMNYAKKHMNIKSSTEKFYDKDNFSVYLRAMYNQEFSSLNRSNRDTLELNSIKLAKSFDL